MSEQKPAFGIIGLGRIGGNLALQALERGFNVTGFARKGAPEYLTRAGLIEISALDEFRTILPAPRVVFVYIPAGPPVDAVLDGLASHLEAGDIVVDGGNSYWGDSIRRHRRLAAGNIRFVDLGTSGGVAGARSGACFMAGGDTEAIKITEPILRALAVEKGYVHAGPPGAGHFVKLVHNGIEFGMLQAIGEGIDLLEHYHGELKIGEILSCWGHGSVIRSWLIDLMTEAYQSETFEKIPAYVEDTGEVNWLVTDAMHMEVAAPVISTAVMQLLLSRDNEKNWARAIAMMRHGFGGHPYGAEESIARERRTGRVGDYFRHKSEKQ
jgi:6-phosphogluconate dehydrogenase